MCSTNIVLRRDRNVFNLFFLEFSQEMDTGSLQAKSLTLQELIKEIETFENNLENEAVFLHWGGIFSAFSAAATISAFAVLNPFAGVILSGTAAISAVGVIGGAIAQNRERSPILETLKKYKLALQSDSCLNWACLWEYMGTEDFLNCLYGASRGQIIDRSLERRDGKNPMAAALDFYCQPRRALREELIAELSAIKSGQPRLCPPKDLNTNANSLTISQPPQLSSGSAELVQNFSDGKEISTLMSLPLVQRAESVIQLLIQDGFKIDEVMASQVIAVCGTQRGGKGTLAGMLATLSKALDPSLNIQYFTTGVDVYPFACNLHSALNFPSKDSEEANKLTAKDLLLFLKGLDSCEPYTHNNLLLVIDEAMRLLSLLDEGDRTWAIQYLLSNFAKCGGTLILVLHGSNLTSVVGKATAGLADTFKESISFVGCVAQSVKASGLRKINVASGVYFKANPNNFGEPVADGDLGAVPNWLRTESHSGNGQPDPVRTLLKFFPELVQNHTSTSLSAGTSTCEDALPLTTLFDSKQGEDERSHLERMFNANPADGIEPPPIGVKSEDLKQILEIIKSAKSLPISFNAIRNSRKWDEKPGTLYLRAALKTLLMTELIEGNDERGYQPL